MQQMFTGATNFNNGGTTGSSSNPLNFNTLNVTNMQQMFSSVTAFNQPIGSWNTSKVTNMQQLFNSATNFNQDISGWNTSNVEIMTSMFQSATNFNKTIGNWNVSKVTVMSQMFQSATNFNNGGASGTSNIPMNWSAPLCTAFNNMFAACTSFNQPIPNLVNTSGLVGSSNLSSIFQQASNFNQNIGNWDVSRVTNMSNMFRNATNFNNGGSADIANWKTGLVGSMGGMFNGSAFNQPIATDGDKWDVSKVTSFYSTDTATGMFEGNTVFNQNIGNWNVSSATTMRAMFKNAVAFNQNLSAWDTSKVNTMAFMFQGTTTTPTTFNNGQTSGVVGTNPLTWNTSLVTTMTSMFQYCRNFNQDISYNITNQYWNISLVVAMDSMFQGTTTFKHKFNNGQAPGGSTAPMGWTRSPNPNPSAINFRTDCELTAINKPSFVT
jgi:surface protein